jgi:hypothetical protein
VVLPAELLALLPPADRDMAARGSQSKQSISKPKSKGVVVYDTVLENLAKKSNK